VTKKKSEMGRSRKTILQIKNEQSIHFLMKGLVTKKEKQDLVRENMSDLFYMFGETLTASKPYLTYMEN
jgi:hypothetical protein